MSDKPKYDADKLVQVYIKIRDAKAKLTREYEAKYAELQEKLGIIEQELLEICKTTGQNGGKTSNGTFTRSVKTFYWSSNWDAMRSFVKEHDAIDLIEQRIHQGNMKTFLQENPDLLPVGLNVDSRYAITVKRASK